MTYLFNDGSAFASFCAAVYRSNIVDDVLQPMFQCVFLLVSGIACRYSRSNLRRGAAAFGLGFMLEIITCYILPAIDKSTFAGVEIHFGILSCLGFCMMFWGVFGELFDKVFRNKVTKFLVPFALLPLWYVTYGTSRANYDFDGWYWLGFPSKTFASADYFPIMPWIFMFLLGAWLGVFIRDGRFPKWFYRVRIPFFDFIGRYTIWIYLLHQPVVFGLCRLIFVIMK